MTSISKKDLTSIIVRPRITEKAAAVTAHNIYTFEISKRADKRLVAQAVKELYNVTPIAVNILNVKAKKVMSRGKPGVKSSKRKAYVTLKAGDKIELV